MGIEKYSQTFLHAEDIVINVTCLAAREAGQLDLSQDMDGGRGNDGKGNTKAEVENRPGKGKAKGDNGSKGKGKGSPGKGVGAVEILQSARDECKLKIRKIGDTIASSRRGDTKISTGIIGAAFFSVASCSCSFSNL